MLVAEITHDIALSGDSIPISVSPNSKSKLFFEVTADANLDGGNVRVEPQHSNSISGPFEDMNTAQGPQISANETINVDSDNFTGAYAGIQLTGGPTMGIITVKTFYKD